jgi:hypothetical protein
MKGLRFAFLLSVFVACCAPEASSQAANTVNMFFVDDSNGHVSDLFGKFAECCPGLSDATVAAGAPVAATATPSGLTSYAYGNDVSVVYEGTDSSILQITFDTINGWSVLNLSTLADAPAAAPGSSLANIFNLGENNQAYIYYFGTDLHIHELTKNTKGAWVTKDETVAAGAPNAAANSPMVTLLFDGDFFVHYLTSAGHVQEIYASANPSSGTWHTRDLTRLSGAPNAFMGGGSLGEFPSALANSSAQHEHVFFYTSDGDVHEIYSFGNGSFATDDPNQNGAPVSINAGSLTAWTLSNQIYVAYPFQFGETTTSTGLFVGVNETGDYSFSETPSGTQLGGSPETSAFDSSTGEETMFFAESGTTIQPLVFGGPCGLNLTSECVGSAELLARDMAGRQLTSAYLP